MRTKYNLQIKSDLSPKGKCISIAWKTIDEKDFLAISETAVASKIDTYNYLLNFTNFLPQKARREIEELLRLTSEIFNNERFKGRQRAKILMPFWLEENGIGINLLDSSCEDSLLFSYTLKEYTDLYTKLATIFNLVASADKEIFSAFGIDTATAKGEKEVKEIRSTVSNKRYHIYFNEFSVVKNPSKKPYDSQYRSPTTTNLNNTQLDQLSKLKTSLNPRSHNIDTLSIHNLGFMPDLEFCCHELTLPSETGKMFKLNTNSNLESDTISFLRENNFLQEDTSKLSLIKPEVLVQKVIDDTNKLSNVEPCFVIIKEIPNSLLGHKYFKSTSSETRLLYSYHFTDCLHLATTFSSLEMAKLVIDALIARARDGEYGYNNTFAIAQYTPVIEKVFNYDEKATYSNKLQSIVEKNKLENSLSKYDKKTSDEKAKKTRKI